MSGLPRQPARLHRLQHTRGSAGNPGGIHRRARATLGGQSREIIAAPFLQPPITSTVLCPQGLSLLARVRRLRGLQGGLWANFNDSGGVGGRPMGDLEVGGQLTEADQNGGPSGGPPLVPWGRSPGVRGRAAYAHPGSHARRNATPARRGVRSNPDLEFLAPPTCRLESRSRRACRRRMACSSRHRTDTA
jgi:hypothetical protein